MSEKSLDHRPDPRTVRGVRRALAALTEKRPPKHPRFQSSI